MTLVSQDFSQILSGVWFYNMLMSSAGLLCPLHF